MGRVHKTPEHRATRAAWAPVVAAGEAYCAELICLFESRWIPPGSAWDMAHDREHGGYLGPAHASCNRSEGATFGNLLRRHGGQLPAQRPPAPTTPWSSRVW